MPYPYNLWVTEQYRHRDGDSKRVMVAIGPGAHPLRDHIINLLRRHNAGNAAVQLAISEIHEMFEGHPESEPKQVLANLEHAIGEAFRKAKEELS